MRSTSGIAAACLTACHGLGSQDNFDNARGDYQALCASLAAVE